MPGVYRFSCDCGAIAFQCEGPPRVRGFCHCEDCRGFLKVPYHSVDAWEKDRLTITSGEGLLAVYQHPQKRM
ncbi:hypothetical protein Maes01_01477 [Microbulbifer aestuariivivens]|uniref:CENP-V/GFA domain-containing protein n=1 Tax=Microbulbifer aestuariivivens TaxID=1908308 RepID=A0ABP9WRM2_9GAMM